MEAERSLVRVLGGLVDDGSLTGASAAIVRGDETSIVTLGPRTWPGECRSQGTPGSAWRR